MIADADLDETVAALCTRFQLQSRTDDPRTFLHRELGGPPHQGDGKSYEDYYYRHAALLNAMRKKLQADEVTRLEAEVEQLKVQLAWCYSATQGWTCNDDAPQRGYGTTQAFEAVVELRKRYDNLMYVPKDGDTR